VTVRQRRLPGARDAADDLDRLGGVGEAQPGDGGDLQGAELDAAVAMVAGAVHHRDLPPRQPDQLGVEGGLVGLDDQQVVGAAVDQEGGVVALGVQRVLCRGGCYAEVVGGGRWWGDRAGGIGIITGLALG
jgi:hypothetical protein